MFKIRCNVCSNEKGGFCTIKKVKVHANKKRKCDDYIYDSSKLKVKHKIPSVRIGYAEEQDDRRRAKEHLKELKRLVNTKPGQKTAQNLGLGDLDSTTIGTNIKHPLTGDLSRFTTTATKKD